MKDHDLQKLRGLYYATEPLDDAAAMAAVNEWIKKEFSWWRRLVWWLKGWPYGRP